MNDFSLIEVLKNTFSHYKKDNITTYAASLSYFTAFSLSPLLILSVSLVGYLYGEEKAQEQAVSQVQKIIGPEGAELIRQLLINASAPGGGTVATVIGIFLLIFGASRVFSALKTTLNIIWQVQHKERKGIKYTIKNELFTFLLVAVIGILFLISLIASVALSFTSEYTQSVFPFSPTVMAILNFLVPYVLIVILYAIIFKILPGVKIPSKVILRGATLAALLFTIGRILIGMYITRSSVASAYGAAASLVVLLLWVFYSAQILFFSTEFMKSYAQLAGIPIEAKKGRIKYIVTTETSERTIQLGSWGEKMLSFVISGIFLRMIKRLLKR